jgi:hypothetical protein
MMGQHQQQIVAGSALRRLVLVLSVAAVMAALLAASVRPAFAAPNTTYTCFDAASGNQVAAGLSKGQANQFEKTSLDTTFCVPTGQQEQLAEEVPTVQRQLAEEVLTSQRKLVKEVPPGQRKQLAEEVVAPEIQRQLAEEAVAPEIQRQLA